MLAYDTITKKIIHNPPNHPRFVPTNSMSERQRTILINSFVPLSMHVANYLNQSTTNRIKEFKHHYMAMVKGKEEVDINLLNVLLVDVEKEFWFRMK